MRLLHYQAAMLKIVQKLSDKSLSGPPDGNSSAGINCHADHNTATIAAHEKGLLFVDC